MVDKGKIVIFLLLGASVVLSSVAFYEARNCDPPEFCKCRKVEILINCGGESLDGYRADSFFCGGTVLEFPGESVFSTARSGYFSYNFPQNASGLTIKFWFSDSGESDIFLNGDLVLVGDKGSVLFLTEVDAPFSLDFSGGNSFLFALEVFQE